MDIGPPLVVLYNGLMSLPEQDPGDPVTEAARASLKRWAKASMTLLDVVDAILFHNGALDMSSYYPDRKCNFSITYKYVHRSIQPVRPDSKRTAVRPNV